MGTSSTNWSNEWIELKNISENNNSLEGWQLLDKDEEIKVIFGSNDSLSANGFYLLERTNDDSVPNIPADEIYTGNLEDNNESLRLFDENCNLIDEVLADIGENLDWPAGNKEERRSMERNQDLSWHTYYGEGEDGIMGTPKAENSQPSEVGPPTPVPILGVSPISLEFTAIEGGENPEIQTLNINNIGEGVLEWTTTVEYTSPSIEGINWLIISPDSGTAPSEVAVSEVAVSVDLSGLTPGIYLADVIISADGIQGSPQKIDVSLNIQSLPEEEQPTKILITEIQISPIEERFIELYNPNENEVNLTGWYIQRKTKTGTSWTSFVSSTKFEGKLIPSRSHFLIIRSPIANFDILLEDLTLTEDNVILIKNPNREIVDKVGWGESQDFETAPAQNPPTGKSIGRKWISQTQKYQDTNDNSIDFEIQEPTPKSKNQAIEEPSPPFEIAVSGADTVWNLHLITASEDVRDSTDSPPQDLAEAFVSHADTVWNLDYPTISLDVIDSTDAPPQILPQVYVSEGESTFWSRLEKQF